MSTQIFPMVDPYLVLFFVPGYRKKLPKFMQKAFNKTDEITNQSSTTSTVMLYSYSFTRKQSTMICGLVSENFYHGYSYVATAFACVLNTMLIYVLIVTHVNHVGPYRWMLLSFSVVEIMISLVHFALIPAIHLTEFGYIYWGYRVLDLPTDQGVLASLIWVLLFYQTFVLTAFHYVYRFVLLSDFPRCERGFLPEVYEIDLYAPNKPGFLGIVYWTLHENGNKVWVRMALITIFCIVMVFSTSGMVIVYCLVRIITEMAPRKHLVRRNGYNLPDVHADLPYDRSVSRAVLCARTIIPAITSHPLRRSWHSSTHVNSDLPYDRSVSRPLLRSRIPTCAASLRSPRHRAHICSSHRPFELRRLLKVGPDRWLLFSFGVIDILISLLHFALIAAIHMTEFAYIFWGHRWLEGSTEQDVWSTRFLITRWGERTCEMRRLLLSFRALLETYGFECSEGRRGIDEDEETKRWIAHSLITILVLICLLSASTSIIIFCLMRICFAQIQNTTHATTNVPGSDLSSFLIFSDLYPIIYLACRQSFPQSLHTGQLHSSFSSHYLPMIVPMIFVYFPCAGIINLPMMGFRLNVFPNLVSASLTFFPLIDAFIIIMFGALVSEEFYHAYSYFATAFACSSNALLIYIIITTHVSHVGPYRWLLLSFAVVDILVSLAHFGLVPAIHLSDFGYIFWGYRTLQFSTVPGTWANCVFAVLFYQTFVLTAFHYVYRYVLMCNPSWLSWIQQKPWRNWLIIAIIADVVYIAINGFYPTDFVRGHYTQIMKEFYGIDLWTINKPGFFGIVFWIINESGEKEYVMSSLVTIGNVLIVFCTSAAVMVFCLVRILQELSSSDTSHLKSATRRMHKQLFRALLWQTAIPMVTSYGPMAVIFVGPLTGYPLGGLGTILIMSTQIFSMIDPYLVLFFVQGYRRALPKFVQKFVNNSKPEPTSMSLTSSGYSYFATSFSCIYVLITTHVRPYRWLLLSFSVIDILISLVHFALVPVCIGSSIGADRVSGSAHDRIRLHLLGLPLVGGKHGEGCLVRWVQEKGAENDEANTFPGLVWVILFYQTFVLTAFHYVYRYVLLCNPPWLAWIQRNHCRNWIIVAFVADRKIGGIFLDCVECFTPTDIQRNAFGKEMMDPYGPLAFIFLGPLLTGVHYGGLGTHLLMSTHIFPMIDPFLELFFVQGYRRALPRFLQRVIAPTSVVPTGHSSTAIIDEDEETKRWIAHSLITILVVMICLLSASTSIIIFCLMRIVRQMTPSNVLLKSKTRHMQRQMFRALICQTIIPTITSYGPIAFIFLVPLFTGNHSSFNQEAYTIILLNPSTAVGATVEVNTFEFTTIPFFPAAPHTNLRAPCRSSLIRRMITAASQSGKAEMNEALVSGEMTSSTSKKGALRLLMYGTYTHSIGTTNSHDTFPNTVSIPLDGPVSIEKVQTVVPMLCVYVPYINNLNAPFFDVDDVISPETSASFISAFPLWDAAVIILLMRDDRLVCGAAGKKGMVVNSKVFTSTVAPTTLRHYGPKSV
ncbi:hypothetical protein PRIPAC_79462 [Pristionchus pacificus]|uniref:Serpentine receptor class r-10 n=1 Tax=Pristionchus pacificus TaxID=54126 RepID=A0A2A6CQN2_PRIPA|nr:hypothetical protein PRIPAC_79462 [Pristionchus pacificus]|eukprot:PDM80398.1 G protein-coupled receptor [Pristionchus pacificus]